MSHKTPSKNKKTSEKNTLYELSSGLGVLFFPVLFCIAFLTGYDPSRDFPFLAHSVFMFLFIFCGIMVMLVQKNWLLKGKPKKSLDKLSYLLLSLLGLSVLALFSTQFVY